MKNFEAFFSISNNFLLQLWLFWSIFVYLTLSQSISDYLGSFWSYSVSDMQKLFCFCERGREFSISIWTYQTDKYYIFLLKLTKYTFIILRTIDFFILSKTPLWLDFYRIFLQLLISETLGRVGSAFLHVCLVCLGLS